MKVTYIYIILCYHIYRHLSGNFMQHSFWHLLPHLLRRISGELYTLTHCLTSSDVKSGDSYRYWFWHNFWHVIRQSLTYIWQVPIPIPWTACGVPRGEAGMKFGDPHLTGVESTHNIYLFSAIRWSWICTGWWFQPLWKILVSWDYYSQYMEKMIQTTNQYMCLSFFIFGVDKDAQAYTRMYVWSSIPIFGSTANLDLRF